MSQQNTTIFRSVAGAIGAISTVSSFFMWVLTMQISHALEPVKMDMQEIRASISDLSSNMKSQQVSQSDATRNISQIEMRLTSLEVHVKDKGLY